MSAPYIPATALGGDLVRDWTGPAEGRGIIRPGHGHSETVWGWVPGVWNAAHPPSGGHRLDPRRSEVAHRVADVLRARGHEVGHLLPVALGGRQGDTQANAPIPASCSFDGNARHVEPLPDCLRCGGSGRVTFESDDFPPGTNACCCTCSGCRSEKVTIPAADVSAVLLAASVAGVEAGRGVVRGVLGEWRTSAGFPLYFERDGASGNAFVTPNGWGVSTVDGAADRERGTMGPKGGPEGRAAADAALLRLGYAYLDPAAPFGVVVPFLNLENER